MDLVCHAYPSDPEEQQDERDDDNEEARVRARLSANLLDSWKLCPGLQADRTVDYSVLSDWLERARSLLQAKGCYEIGDHTIGQVLGTTLPGADGTGPQLPVREVIESLASPKLESGIEMAKYNSRGFQWRAPDSGGEPERELATSYREQSSLIPSAFQGLPHLSGASPINMNARPASMTNDRRS